MANTFKFGNKNWAWKEDYVLAYNDENNNFKPLPFDFTRSSSATRVNSSGLIETVGSGEPRVDYLNNADGHLLLEPSRTNSILYSNGFDDSTWQKGLGGTASAPVVTANQGTSPDGSNNAYKVDFDLGGGTTSTDRSRLTQSVTGTSSTEYIFTFYAKAYSTSDVGKIINFSVDNVSDEDANFTLTSEWQRFTFSGTSTGTNINQHIQLRGNLSTSDSASMLLFGYQMETGSYATSYIPTSGSSVTRAADDATNGGNSQVFDNDSAVWFIDCERIGVEGGRAIALENASGTEQLRLHLDSPSALGRFRDALASFATIGDYFTATAGLRIKAALKINGATLSVFVNGSKVGSDYTRPTAFDIQKMHIYGEAFKVNDIKFYNTALTDSELIALTT